MDLLILDENFQATKNIDMYVSLIWTDRYQECGDFELYISAEMREFFVPNYYLYRPDTGGLMIIEDLTIDTSVEDGNYLTVTGRSLESILDRRIIFPQTTLDGKLEGQIKKLIDAHIINPEITSRKIPNFVWEDSGDAKIAEMTITAQYTGDNLYDVICSICQEKGIGFRVKFDGEDKFIFQLYNGKDRSYDQAENVYVVFSPEFDNLLTTNYFQSDKNVKTATWVAGEDVGTDRRALYLDPAPTVTGLHRKEYYTDARDISSSVETLYNPEMPSQQPMLLYADLTNPENLHFIADTTGRKRFIYLPCNPDTEYSVSRNYNCPFKLHLVAWNGTATPGTKITVCSDGNEDSTHDSTVMTGPNDNMLGIILYNPDEDTQTFENSYWDETTSEYVTETETINWTEEQQIEMSFVDFAIHGPLLNADYENLLKQRGSEKLAEFIHIETFEGEADTNRQYVYGRDFMMGDIMSIANEYGIERRVRVLEIVFSQDADGWTSYPSFETIVEEDT